MTRTECLQRVFEFQDLGSKKVVANFDGGFLSSDGGGALILRQIEARTGLLHRLARCFEDRRNPALIEHSVVELLSQRIHGLAMGYEDLNDHNELRRDPAHAMAANKTDPLGLNRRERRDRGKALAGAATLNRLELAAQAPDSRYRKIVADPEAIEELLIREGVRALPRRSREVILDFDPTDDPLHGAQEGAFFQGYYRRYCYLPLYCFCGNIPLWARLRDCKRDASDGTVEALAKIVPAIRQRLGNKVRIIVRADSAFCRESIMSWIESQPNVYYVFGIAKSERLLRHVQGKFAGLRHDIERKVVSAPTRRFTEIKYRTLKSWSRRRRLIAKLEWLPKGPNPRFVVTNLPGEGFEESDRRDGRFRSDKLYEKLYCARGEMENRIKEQQLDLFADRTSTHWMASNQLRLWFSAFAHLIVSRLRALALRGTELENASVGTIRLRLFKIAAQIKVSVRRVLVELCSAYPLKNLMGLIHHRLRAP